jgi:glycosyltransferase involved in cell wall biosynthesis
MSDRSDAILRTPGPDVSVVVPVFEEEASLEELVDRLGRACDESALSYEIILVDDGSRDRSWSVISDLGARDESVLGIRLQRNYGKSAALAAGFNRAQGTYTVTMDADLQDAPEEVPLLVQYLRAEDLDLVSGWKRRRNDPLDKTVPSRFFNFVTRKISRIPLHDFNCGLKAYRTEVVKSVHVYGELHRYIPLLAKWEGFDRIGEKVVEHHPRKHGQTKFGFERFVRGFLDLISVVFLTRFAARPMHFFGALGTLAFLGGFVISLYLTIDKVLYGMPLGDRPLLLFGVMLILLGAQMFSTGLLGEMMIRREMQDRPTYRVREDTTSALSRFA